MKDLEISQNWEIVSPTIIELPKKDLSTRKPFIVSNTIPCDLGDIQRLHIIPVFVKDNEPVINHSDFIEVVHDVARSFYRGETINCPTIRVSHPIKGRVAEARNKPAKDLQEYEKTIYYERMAFQIEVPSITDIVSGNELSLCIGGVKAYNLDNLYNRKGVDEHFKIFVGFQNRVCTNLCISTDGLVKDLKVKSIRELMDGIFALLQNYDPILHLKRMKYINQYSLTEVQFATLIGRCRMYQHLPKSLKSKVPTLEFSDTQLNSVVRDYFSDQSFCREEDGSISLWNLYNLFTGANKNSYIDTYVDRANNAFDFAESLSNCLGNREQNWFLS